MNPPPSSPVRVLVSTTQRCGSTWITSMCRKIVDQTQEGEYVPGLAQKLMDLSQFGSHEEERVAGFSAAVRDAVSRTGSRVFKTHDLPLRLVPIFLRQNPDFFVFNIVRDFRDVMISRLMYSRYYLPTRGMPIECEFVAQNPHFSDLDMVRRFYGTPEMLEWLVQWKLFSEPLQHDRYVRLGYELMLDAAELERTVDHLGQKLIPGGLPPEKVAAVAAASRFQEIDINHRQDRKQQEVKTAFCRLGVAGDYERFLTKSQIETLKVLMQ